MAKDVWISISNRQHAGQEGDNTLLFDTAGSYDVDENGAVILRYRESALTGMEGTWTKVKVSPGEVIVDRNGLISGRLTFREGERDSFPYETPYGQLMMGVKTRRISNRLTDAGGEVEIDYLTDLAHAYEIRNQFRISVKEMEASHG